MSERLRAVDGYIANAALFAQPILVHLREIVHRAVPEAVEQIKWSRPFFVYRGVVLGHMAAFKAHCAFALYGGEMAETLQAGGITAKQSMGSFGKITSLADLPSDSQLNAYLQQAAGMIAMGAGKQSVHRVAKPARVEEGIPAALAQAFEGHQDAAKRFAALSPSCRREYVEWIGSAKREETRLRRATAALEQIVQGKSYDAKQIG